MESKTRPMPRRAPTAAVDPMFMERWSPRAFSPEPLTERQLHALFEAARWAPSAFNEQPWRFAYAATAEDRERFLAPLHEGNRQWAERAPVIVYVLAKKRLSRNGKPNRHALFDAGAAWMSLALQAHRMGLATHPMGGFDREAAREALGADAEEYEVVAAVAVGRRGDGRALPEALRKREHPSTRRPLEEVAFEGGLPEAGEA